MAYTDLTIEWDEAQDASATIGRNNGDRFVRIGLVSGITAANTTAPLAMGDALKAACLNSGAIPQTYPHPDFSTAKLAYVTVQPHPQDHTKARVWAGYEPIAFSGSPVDRFAVEDVTLLVNEPTGYLPGSRTPLVVSLTTTSPPDNPTVQDANFRTVEANYPRNYRSLVLSGLFSSKPSSAMLLAANRVNSTSWMSLPAGYWRCEGPKVRWASAAGLYSVSVGFLSKGRDDGDDWSTWEFARDPLSGQYVQVKKTVLDPLLAQSYDYGIRYKINGVLKVGMYKTANFGVIFDPLIDDTPLGGSDGFANLVGR